MKALSKWLLVALILIFAQLLLSDKSWAGTDYKNRKVISVIDTGIDLKNEKLKASLCQNSGEMGWDQNGNRKEFNGKDDDGNGFTDDVHGWSFYDESKDIQDHHGHGTHIVSVISAELKSLKLTDQYCFQILKYYDSDTFSNELLSASNQSFQYALENETSIVNYSGGGYTPNNEEIRLIQKMKEKNIPVIAAMGNQKLNTDQIPFYPASYTSENIFAIAAADQTQSKAVFSNYGKKHFDFLAPGVLIKGAGLEGTEVYLSGTSQATAKTTALVAYLMSQNQEEKNWKNLKDTIKSWRKIYQTKNKRENQNYIDSNFIKKYKSAKSNAFGEQITQ